MRLHIRSKNFSLTDALREQVRSRLAFALARFRKRIKNITASLIDLNGRKGGVDKQCRLIVQLLPNRTVTIEETDSNVSAAIARAADRAGHTVSRTLERCRNAKIDRHGFSPRNRIVEPTTTVWTH
ncbi:MAG: HPF/RaiA family ribosome-associated protein [Acidobacteria bacterium]|nr:HPF/RaiA family ribosome-associated protein [Acidobacteriota bacterium]